jgi:uncharacterized RDD family membrane protein YckC
MGIMPNCKNCGFELPPDSQYCPHCGAPVATAETAAPVYTAPSPPPFTPRLATWGERFVAWLIDAIIVSIFISILSITAWFAWQPLNFWPSWLPLINFGPGGFIYFLYWMLMEGLYGQSIGKMVMRIRVTRLNGSPAGLGFAALESVGKSFLLVLDIIIGWFLYPRRRQRLFNYLSETIVVQDHR